jgi:ATP-dependent DNA ligase
MFDTLYGCDVKGKMKSWSIIVTDNNDHSVIKTDFGYVNGKMTTSLQTISTGKNIGKRNETTHYEQAISEAKSKWKKKSEQGYSTNQTQTTNQEKTTTQEKTLNENQITNVITFPMLAQDYNKQKNKLVYPAYIQPKLDGYRMIYNSKTQYCNSRQGKEFEIIRQTDLYKELTKITGEFILDGELYLHNGIFEHLGILRKKKLSKDDIQKINQIEYHVYDIVLPETSYQQRYQILMELFEKLDSKKINVVLTKMINSEQELKDSHLEFVSNNYEGSIVRNREGKYRCKARSSDLLKYKDFEDAEFKIVDFTFEKDTSKDNENLIVWICENQSGTRFNIRPKGTREERQELYKRGSEFIGSWLQVKYFELTENNVPRFPTTKSESYTTYIRNIVE